MTIKEAIKWISECHYCTYLSSGECTEPIGMCFEAKELAISVLKAQEDVEDDLK